MNKVLKSTLILSALVVSLNQGKAAIPGLGDDKEQSKLAVIIPCETIDSGTIINIIQNNAKTCNFFKCTSVNLDKVIPEIKRTHVKLGNRTFEIESLIPSHNISYECVGKDASPVFDLTFTKKSSLSKTLSLGLQEEWTPGAWDTEDSNQNNAPKTLYSLVSIDQNPA
ncbi:MAG: hypothetical protein ACRC12_03255 [Holosporales bacterium]